MSADAFSSRSSACGGRWTITWRMRVRPRRARPRRARVRSLSLPKASRARCVGCTPAAALAIDVNVPSEHAIRGQREDLDEMLGNLLDNACKWARTRVARRLSRTDAGGIVITVDDDGPGLVPAMREAVLQRGVRADEAAPGLRLRPGDRPRPRGAVRRLDCARRLAARRPPRATAAAGSGVMLAASIQPRFSQDATQQWRGVRFRERHRSGHQRSAPSLGKCAVTAREPPICCKNRSRPARTCRQFICTRTLLPCAVHDMRRKTSVEQILRDLRHAWRAMVRAPLLAAVVIVSLGVGIGVNTVVFSWIQALVFRPLPGVADASSFHLVEARAENGTRPGVVVARVSRSAGATRRVSGSVGVSDGAGQCRRGQPDRADVRAPRLGQLLSPLSACGRRWAGFSAATRCCALVREPVVVISHGFWQTRLGGSATVVGQTLRVNDHDLTIVGVTPEGFQGTVLGLAVRSLGARDVGAGGAQWLAGARRAQRSWLLRHGKASRRRHDSCGPGRGGTGDAAACAELHPATMRRCTVDAARILARFARTARPAAAGPRDPAGHHAGLCCSPSAATPPTCSWRAPRARQREIGVRLAVGAGSWRIVRLLLIENVRLGMLAAGLGTLIAMWGTQALRAMPLTTAVSGAISDQRE